VNLVDVLWVGLAGAAGAATRFVLDGALRGRFGGRVAVGTILINVSGSLVLGILTGLVVFHGAPPALTLVAGTGFCGGYTTFSTSCFETIRLVQGGDFRAAATTGAATFAGALLAAGAGLALASM
jgi:CrcB protein